MARIDSIALPFTHAGIDKVVQLYRTGLPKLYPQYVDTDLKTNQGYYQVAQEGDFQAAPVVNQSTGIPVQDFQTGPYKTFYAVKHGLGFAVASETEEADLYGIIKRKTPKMLTAMQRTIEADMANNLNAATSTVLTPPDGVALAGTHTFTGGTYSNVISGNPALGVLAVEQAVGEFMNQPSQTGMPLMFPGPFTLMVPPALEFLAKRIVNTTRGLPQTNNNDINAVSSSIDRIVVNPYFTSPTAWGLVISDKKANPLKMWTRRDYQTQEEFDKNHDIFICYCTQIWTRVLDDWRGFAFSSGLGS